MLAGCGHNTVGVVIILPVNGINGRSSFLLASCNSLTTEDHKPKTIPYMVIKRRGNIRGVVIEG